MELTWVAILASLCMAIAAVCHPDAASPPSIVFFAASSSR